ncbi:MAG TPA: glutaredoxin family protein [Vicinamibacteria bacterium]|nr:glutaredoxin family protein [Vicinamibacteria bacterium]
MKPLVLTLLGKPDCHLCHEMRAVLDRALPAGQVQVVEKDVREDPELRRRYLNEIPVLLLAGREVVRHRVTESELLQRLSEMGWPPA